MRTALVVMLLVGFVPMVRAQGSAREVINRAIVAHGGYEQLSRARADKARMRGVLYTGGSMVPFTSEVTVALPKRYKMVVRTQSGDRTHTLIHEMDGDAVTISLDGKAIPAQGTHINQLRQTLELETALRLVPLLDEKAFSLTHMGDFKMVDRMVTGVRVQGRGQRDLKLYFDKQNGLLVKTEQTIDGENGKDVRQEAFYREHREEAGHIRAGRAAAYRDGKKVMEAELVEVVRLQE